MIGTIHFTGPRGRAWAMTPVDLADPGLGFKIEESIKRNSGIMSKGWGWSFDLDSGQGSISSGFRTVGTIAFVPLATPSGGEG